MVRLAAVETARNKSKAPKWNVLSITQHTEYACWQSVPSAQWRMYEEKGSRDAEVFPCSLFLHGADGKNVAASEFCEVM